MIRRILRIGIPNGIEGSVFQIGKLLVQGFISVFGTASLAASAIATSITGFVNIPGGAIGLASITVVGQAMGAKKPDQAVFYAKKLLMGAYLAMACIAILIYLFSHQIIAIFNLSEEATSIAVLLLHTAMIFSAIFWPTAFALPNFLRAAGDVKYVMLVSMFSMWAFRVGFSYVLAVNMGLGAIGVWYGMYIDWVCRSICFLWRFSRGRWKTKRVI